MIARKSFLILSSRLLTRIFGYIGLVVLAKIWGSFAPEALGIVGFAMSFLAIFNIVSDLGFSRAHVKRISEGKDIGICIGTYALIKLILNGAMVLIILTSIFIWKVVLNSRFYDATTESVIYVFILYYVFTSLAQIAMATFEGRREIAKRQVTEMSGGIKFVFMIIVALAGSQIAGITPAVEWPSLLTPLQEFIERHSLGSLAMTYVLSASVTLYVGLWLLRSNTIKRPSWEMFQSYFSFALPIMTISIISILSVNIDKIMIGFFWTSIEVGYYFTVQQIIQLLIVLATAVMMVLFPTISEHHSQKNVKIIREITHLAERYISMVMIPPIIFIIIFSNSIIEIMLSRAFLPAAPVLIILCIYVLISSINKPFSSLIMGMGRPRISARIGFLVCFANIILNYLFIPKNGALSSFGINGAEGAATATLLSIVLSFMLLRIESYKLTKIQIFKKNSFIHLFSGLLMGFVLYYLSNYLTEFMDIRWYILAFFAFFGLAIYIFILWILKEFNKKDFLFFIDIIHPIEMIKYIYRELKGN